MLSNTGWYMIKVWYIENTEKCLLYKEFSVFSSLYHHYPISLWKSSSISGVDEAWYKTWSISAWRPDLVWSFYFFYSFSFFLFKIFGGSRVTDWEEKQDLNLVDRVDINITVTCKCACCVITLACVIVLECSMMRIYVFNTRSAY